jgi:hypothetical protein
MTPSKLILVTFFLLSGIADCSHENSTVPILILATDFNFGTYTAEILKAEGFNEYQIDSLSDPKFTILYLSQFDLVILGETAVKLSQESLLINYVKAGGNLIVFRPDKRLSGLFGITDANGTVSEGYIALDPNTEQGRGLIPGKMQFHGTADKCTLNGGRTIATLFADKITTKGFPAVVTNNYGKGHTIAFLYNLPKSIVYTRQGNPLFAGIEKDGIPGLRGMDLFTDEWLDASNSTINQADEQMVLLSHCIEKMNTYTKPLPRFWYFPDTLKCLVTLTNDSEYRSETDFEPQFQDVDSLGAKMSIYILEDVKVSKRWTDKWTSRGFEISGHPDDTKEAESPHWNNMNNVEKTKKMDISSRYGITMKTVVDHWFVWCGNDSSGYPEFAAQAEIEANNGLGMDLNYAHYDNNSNQGHFLGKLGANQGNFTGSGLIMKFASSKGRILNIYQHLNNVYDQQYTENHDADGFFNCFKGLMDRSQHNEVYSYISVKSHNDEYYFSKAPLMKMLAYANNNGIPVWTALKLLDFVKMRDEATFTDINWSDNRLSFNLNSSVKHSNGLTIMVPNKYVDKRIKKITLNGKDTTFIIRSVKGSDYAFLPIEPGANYSILVNYGE